MTARVSTRGRAVKVITPEDLVPLEDRIAALEAGGTNTPTGGTPFIYTVVAAADAPQEVKNNTPFVCDGTSDQDVINAAINSVAGTDINKEFNGGTVCLVGRAFYIDGPVLLQSQTEIFGSGGSKSTYLVNKGYAGGLKSGMIQLANSDVQYTTIHDLGFEGNGVDCTGIYLSNGLAQEWDANHIVRDVALWSTGGHGIRLEQDKDPSARQYRTRGNMLMRIRVINAGASGLYIECPDSFFEQISCGSSGGHGFEVLHSNNRFVNCKAWYSDGDGFHLDHGRDNQLAACESQDNMNHGYMVGTARTTLAACVADSNGYGGTGDGYHVEGNGFNIQGCATDKNEGNRGLNQRYGIYLESWVDGIANITTWHNAVAPGNEHALNPGSNVICNVIDT